MYIKKAHILIEQGLQSIGVFAYADMLHEEIDLQINKKTLSLLEDAFDPLKKSKHPYEDGQSILDKFQNLQVKGLVVYPTLTDDYYSCPLPDDYVHLVADASLVLVIDNLSNIINGQIKAGEFYYVLGDKTITYNSVNYTTGQIFQGITGFTGYTYFGTGTLKIVRLKKQKNPNRLQFEEFLDQVLTNYLTGTTYKSPVSSISSGQLFVYYKEFFIWNFFLTYVRKPKWAHYIFTTYSTSDNLVIGQKYESVDNPITYNTVTYQPFAPFTIVSGHLTYSGTATVRAYQDGDIELSDTMSYDVIDAVIAEISILTEQNQQKIVNLTQTED